MSASDAYEHYAARHAAFARERPVPAWLARRREGALAALAATGLPHAKQEEWRYTNPAPILRERYEVAPPPQRAVGRDDLESHAFPVFACSLFAFVNGRFAPELSTGRALPGGARVEDLAGLAGDPPAWLADGLGALAEPKAHPFAALNQAFCEDGAVIHVPRGADAGEPVHLVFLSAPGEEPQVVHPRVLVVAEPGSRIQVIQDHVTVGDAAGFSNPVTEISVGDNASVSWVLLQREPHHRHHVSNLAVRQERDSRFSAHTLTLGGALVRNDAAVLMAGEGAECRLSGLFVGGGRQVLDNHTFVDHAVPHCTSHELYKGILGGAARGIFRGRVVVRPDAQKTVAHQSNPNLLVGRKAEIDTKPQLEIYADDVKCNHGSTIGQLDEDQLFYLRARGVGESQARDVLTRAFGSEILNALPAPALAQALDDLLLEQLRHARQEVA